MNGDIEEMLESSSLQKMQKNERRRIKFTPNTLLYGFVT